MAPRDRDQYKSALQWHLREDSDIRNIGSSALNGAISGLTWKNGENFPAILIIGFLGGMGSGFVADEIKGPADNIDSTYADSTITHHTLSDAALTYSAIDTTADSYYRNPLVLVQEGDVFRLYESSTFDRSGDQQWSFVHSQTEALAEISGMISSLTVAQSDIEERQFETLPEFISYTDISGLYADNAGITSRSAGGAQMDFGGIPIDMSSHIESELELWNSAYEAVESGSYGFTANTVYSVANEDADIEQASTSVIFEAASDQQALTLRPDLPEGPYTEWSDTFFSGVKGTGQVIAGLSLLFATIGGLSAGGSAALQSRRRKRQENTPTP